eukprot:13174451-Heterocapsa_arctica.AAC.1
MSAVAIENEFSDDQSVSLARSHAPSHAEGFARTVPSRCLGQAGQSVPATAGHAHATAWGMQ